jgi:hypothetical protein
MNERITTVAEKFRHAAVAVLVLGVLVSCEFFFDDDESASAFVDTSVTVISDTAIVDRSGTISGSYTYYLDYSGASNGFGQYASPLWIRAYDFDPVTGARGERVGRPHYVDVYPGPGSGTFSLSPDRGDWGAAAALLLEGRITVPVATTKVEDIVLVGDTPLRLYLPGSVEEGDRAIGVLLQTERAARTIELGAQPTGIVDFRATEFRLGQESDRVEFFLDIGRVDQDTMLTVTASDGSNTDSVQIMVTNTPDPVLILPDTGEWRGLWSESGTGVYGHEVVVSVYRTSDLMVHLALSGGPFGNDQANMRSVVASDGGISGQLADTVSGDPRGTLAGTVLQTESGHLIGDLEGTVDGTDVIVRFSIAPFVGPAY